MSPGKEPCVGESDPPFLMMYPTASGYEPLDGGITCSGAKRMSVRAIEDYWLARHDCTRASEPSLRDKGSTCWDHDCQRAALQTCLIEGGHGWTGTPLRARRYRIADCDGPTPKFPMAPHIWDFFARVTPQIE